MATDRLVPNQVVVMGWRPGDDVIIEFDGEDHDGHILKDEGHGWLRCSMVVDPINDYGSGTERLAPHQTVAVQTTRVRPRMAD